MVVSIIIKAAKALSVSLEPIFRGITEPGDLVEELSVLTEVKTQRFNV